MKKNAIMVGITFVLITVFSCFASIYTANKYIFSYVDMVRETVVQVADGVISEAKGYMADVEVLAKEKLEDFEIPVLPRPISHWITNQIYSRFFELYAKTDGYVKLVDEYVRKIRLWTYLGLGIFYLFRSCIALAFYTLLAYVIIRQMYKQNFGPVLLVNTFVLLVFNSLDLLAEWRLWLSVKFMLMLGLNILLAAFTTQPVRVKKLAQKKVDDR